MGLFNDSIYLRIKFVLFNWHLGCFFFFLPLFLIVQRTNSATIKQILNLEQKLPKKLPFCQQHFGCVPLFPKYFFDFGVPCSLKFYLTSFDDIKYFAVR